MSVQPMPAPPKQLPRIVVIAAVILTGGVTAWAMSATHMRGPVTSWDMSQSAVNQVWTDPAAQMPMAPMTPIAPVAPGAMNGAMQPQSPAPNMMPNPGNPMAAMSPQPQGRRVAGLPGVPNIINGSVRPHRDRGACSNCHGVLDGRGRPVPSINADSRMPHSFRGTCSNCHQVVVGGALRGIAATVALPGVGGGFSTAAPQSMAIAPPTDADWRGMEVRAADRGVIVTKAEGAARRTGLQPGDRVGSINGVQVQSMADFIAATRNGALPQGTAIIDRGGERLAFEMLPTTRGPAPGIAPQLAPLQPAAPPRSFQSWQPAQPMQAQPMQSMQPAQPMQPIQPRMQALQPSVPGSSAQLPARMPQGGPQWRN